MKTSLLSVLVGSALAVSTAADEPWQRELTQPLPARQVHLDFHTSELIEGIGARFDKAQWQAALKAGRVNHINVFGKGHHSWSYYPTEIGMQHPHLNFDLLGAQIEASHEIGVKVPIYFTVGWSVNDAENHPEWTARNRDGSFMVYSWDFDAKPTDVRPHYSWKFLCPNPDGEYHRLILKQVEEICRRYEVNGFWFDIYHSADIADATNLDQLAVLLLPSRARLDEGNVAALRAFVKGGGKVISFGKGLFCDDGAPALDAGVRLVGDSDFDFDYTVLKSADLGHEMVSSPFLTYESGVLLEPGDADVLASIREPYFNRTYASFSSHRETPYRLEDSGYPAVTRKGDVIVFAHELDRLYYTHAVRLHRQVVQNAIDALYDAPMLRVDGLPSAGRVSLLHQADQRRYVAHLLYGPALQRGEVMVIEDLPPIESVRIRVRVPEKVTNAYVIPGEIAVGFERDGDAISIAVPDFTMHTGVVLEY